MNVVRAVLVGVVACLVAFACDRSPTAAPTAPLAAKSVATSSSRTGGLVVCSQAYDSVTQVIGPTGGIITVGPHIFLVDSFALSTPVSITAVAPADTVRWVRFQPNGLVFQTGKNGWPAIIYTSYRDCAVSPTVAPRIALVSDSLSILGYLQTYVQTKKNPWSQANAFAAGLLWHFSNYAVAW